MSKKDITDLEDKALSVINKLKVVEYTSDGQDKIEAGLIPEDSADVCTEEGKAVSLSTQVNYNTKGIQEIYRILEQHLGGGDDE